MADQIQYELVGLYQRSDAELAMSQIKVEHEEYPYSFEESIVEEVDVTTQAIDWKETSNKKLLQKMNLEGVTVKEPQASPSPFVIPRKTKYSKVDKDAGLIVVMIGGKKHYQCDFCGMNKFPSRSRLKSHRQIHTAERNFMCQVCRSFH